MADGMKESHKKTTLALDLVTTALDAFEHDVLNKIVTLESKERSMQNELVAAAARIESSEFLLKMKCRPCNRKSPQSKQQPNHMHLSQAENQ